jgi:hypothetical protein
VGRLDLARILITVFIYSFLALCYVFRNNREVIMPKRQTVSEALKNQDRPATLRQIARTAPRPRHEKGQGVALPASLHEAIEIERDNLARAESLLGCLAISMECESESATGPYYPDVAQIAREMVRRSINGLDSLALERVYLRNKVKEEYPVRFALAPCYTALAYGPLACGPLTYDAAGIDRR